MVRYYNYKDEVASVITEELYDDIEAAGSLIIDMPFSAKSYPDFRPKRRGGLLRVTFQDTSRISGNLDAENPSGCDLTLTVLTNDPSTGKEIRVDSQMMRCDALMTEIPKVEGVIAEGTDKSLGKTLEQGSDDGDSSEIKSTTSVLEDFVARSSPTLTRIETLATLLRALRKVSVDLELELEEQNLDSRRTK